MKKLLTLLALTLLPATMARGAEWDIAIGSTTFENPINISSAVYFETLSTPPGDPSVETLYTTPGGLYFDGVNYNVWDNGTSSWVSLLTSASSVISPWYQSGNNVLLSTPTSWVGIGVTNPDSPFQVKDGTMTYIDFQTSSSTVYLGYGAGGLGTSINNVAVGDHALFNNSGNGNVAIGHNALILNSTGTQNVAIGTFALRNNTYGLRNVAIGTIALGGNVTGQQNIGIGMFALATSTSGVGNTAIGGGALSGNHSDYNVAIGAAANGFGNTSATTKNTIIGTGAMYQNEGGDNTVVGFNSAATMTTGNNNIFIGSMAGYYFYGGNNNILIGSNQDFPFPNLNNALQIGSLIYGDMSNGWAGIGTFTPQYSATAGFDVAGYLYISSDTHTQGDTYSNRFYGPLTGNVTGNSDTATSLAANGSNCSAANAPLGVNAFGASEGCFQVALPGANADITSMSALKTLSSPLTVTSSETITGGGGLKITYGISAATATFTGTVTAATFSGAFSGNATTATSLAANGTNCSAANAPLGVDASGNSESCFQVALPGANSDITSMSALASLSHALTISSSETINGAGGLTILYGVNAATGVFSGAVSAGSFSGPLTGNVTGNASTASALAANGTNCSAANAPLGVDAAGNSESCFQVALPGSNSDITSMSALASLSHALTNSSTETITGQDASGYSLKVSSGINASVGCILLQGGQVCGPSSGSVPADTAYTDVDNNWSHAQTSQSSWTIKNDLKVTGSITTGTSIIFPDGSVQLVAAVDSAWQSQVITSSTTNPTFTVPSQSSMVYVSMCGGGGGGGGGGSGTNIGGGGGASGLTIYQVPIFIGHSGVITISGIGAKGTGGAANTTGTAGTSTTIYYTDLTGNVSTMTAIGGGPGTRGGSGGQTLNGGGVTGFVTAVSTGVAGGTYLIPPFIAAGGGGGNNNATGGNGGISVTGTAGGAGGTGGAGGGGNSPWGIGGAGGTTSVGPTAATGFCAGGGGGNGQSGAQLVGAAGSPGLVIFSWVGVP